MEQAPELPLPNFAQLGGLSGSALREALAGLEPLGPQYGYSLVRDIAYTWVFLDDNGEIFDHYQLDYEPASPDPTGVNWEHVIPQSSHGASGEELRNTPYKSHAFDGLSTFQKANAERGHKPFADGIRDVTYDGDADGSSAVTVGVDAKGRAIATADPRIQWAIAVRSLWMYSEAPELFADDYKFSLAHMVNWLIKNQPSDYDMKVVKRAEKLEGESLYFAHAEAFGSRAEYEDFIIRAFADVLQQFRGENEEIAALAARADQLSR
jgi:hypothetical protein